MQHTKPIRRKLVIEPGFQFRGAWLVTGICLALAAFLIFAMGLFVRHYFLELDKDGSFLSPQVSELYHQAWFQLLGILAAISVGYCAIVFWATLFLTRNIVGPVVGFSRRVKELLDSGDPKPLKFRKGDELQTLIDVYNDICTYVTSETKQKRDA